MALTLYSTKVCPFTERILLLIAWSRIPDISIKHIPLQKIKPEIMASCSPYHRVPVLVFNNEKLSDGRKKCIWESPAIFQFLDDTNPPPIMRGTPYEKAMQRSFTHYCNAEFSKAVYTYLFEDDREALDRCCDFLDDHRIVVDGYIDPMMIDFSYAPFLNRIKVLMQTKNYVPTDLLTDWMQRCDEHFATFYPNTTKELVEFYTPYVSGTKTPFSKNWKWH